MLNRASAYQRLDRAASVDFESSRRRPVRATGAGLLLMGRGGSFKKTCVRARGGCAAEPTYIRPATRPTPPEFQRLFHTTCHDVVARIGNAKALGWKAGSKDDTQWAPWHERK